MKKSKSLSLIRSSGDHRQYNPKKGLHSHSHYEILLILKGGGTHTIETEQCPVLDNQVFFLKPGQHHFFQPSSSAKFLFLAIDSEILSSYTTLYLRDFDFFQTISNTLYIQDKKLVDLVPIFKEIQLELENKQTNHDILLSSLITTLLVKLERYYIKHQPKKQKNTKLNELQNRFFRLLSDRDFNSRFVRDYAEKCFINANYFNVSIKKSTGFSASYWIHQQTIIDAKRALLHTNEPINTIAKALGFKNSTHFTRLFKQHVDQTPKSFRKNINK